MDLKDFKKTLINNSKTTPFIALDIESVNKSLDFFTKTMQIEKTNIFYPIKVNSNISIVKRLIIEGVGFECGAFSECEYLINNGVLPSRIIFGNPVKSVNSIRGANEIGVDVFAIDSEEELMKIHENAPNSKVYFRISVSNEGSSWELTDKFGCDTTAALQLAKKAICIGLIPIGISFHIGWNNPNLSTWQLALEKSITLAENLINKRILLEFINIGGGFPSHLNNSNLLLEKIAIESKPYFEKIKTKLNLKIIAEPGSFLVANSAVMVVSIFEKINRGKKTWLYVDSGICQGFYWILSGLKYGISALNNSEVDKSEFIVCGPTCDTHDVFSFNIMLPKNIDIGDKLIIYPAGAYISSSKKYNGFDYPEEIII